MSVFLHCSESDLEAGLEGGPQDIDSLPASRDGVRRAIIETMGRDFPTSRLFRWLVIDRQLQGKYPKRGPMRGRRPGKIIEPAPNTLSPEEVWELCGEEVDQEVAEPYAIRLCERRANREFLESLIGRSDSGLNEALTRIGMTVLGLFDPIQRFLGKGLKVGRGSSIVDSAITEARVATALEIAGRAMDPQADEDFDLLNEVLSVGLGTAVRVMD